MKTKLRNVTEDGKAYTTLTFACPGCVEMKKTDGVHILPVYLPGEPATAPRPSWEWDGNLDAPTLSPSIATMLPPNDQCHSFLTAGVFEFLADSTHSMAGQSVPLLDLPGWVENLK